MPVQTLSRRLLLPSLLALLGGGVTAAHAQQAPAAYPDRAVRLVVPANPGSLTDPVARVLAEEMKRRTGQPWNVDNRPGAGGIIGGDVVARAASDGYTLLFSANNLLISPAMYRNVPYKVSEAFTPIGLVARADNLLVASAKTGWRGMADLLAAARKSADGVDYTSPLIGSAAHLIVELFRTEAGIRLNHIPHKDAGQGTADDGLVRVAAISHIDRFERKAENVQLLESALEEALDQRADLVHPLPPDSPMVGLAHDRVARLLG